MAKKIYCDACSAEMPDGRRGIKATVQLSTTATVDLSGCQIGNADICERCILKAFAKKLSRTELMALVVPSGWFDENSGQRMDAIKVGGIDYAKPAKPIDTASTPVEGFPAAWASTHAKRVEREPTAAMIVAARDAAGSESAKGTSSDEWYRLLLRAAHDAA